MSINIASTYNFPTMPRQNVSAATRLAKNKKWYKENLDFAEYAIGAMSDFRTGRDRKIENYNLRANVLDVRNIQRYIDPHGLGLDNFPASLFHVGIGNTKLNSLLGEYSGRKTEMRVFLSNQDEDGISRKENQLMSELTAETMKMIQNTALSKQDLEKRVAALQHYAKYDFQDIAEKYGNVILHKEYREKELDFVFENIMDDQFCVGEQAAMVDIFGKEPEVRRIDPRNTYTLGGKNSLYYHDKDMILIIEYFSPGKILDDHWDELSKEDRTKLENLSSNPLIRGNFNLDLGGDPNFYNVPELNGAEQLTLYPASYRAIFQFGGYTNAYGEVRKITAFWRTKVKVGIRSSLDPKTGAEMIDYVNEYYVPNENEGEFIEWKEINQWARGTKIGPDIYTRLGMCEDSADSVTNLSLGTPPIVGITLNTNNYVIPCALDIVKPFDYAYDIGFFKRQLEINTFKGSTTAINASFLPSNMDPTLSLHWAALDKTLLFNPHEEVLEGPNQGKPASIYNNVVTQEVKLGANAEGVTMLNNYLTVLEYTMGKVLGVPETREGIIDPRQAVRNTEREMVQNSKITERYFKIDALFRRAVLNKFLKVCQRCYKENPKKAQYVLDDLGQVFFQHINEALDADLDVHVGNFDEDMKVIETLKGVSQAAMQNGQATLVDMIDISTTRSLQELRKKLQLSVENLQRMQQENQAAAFKAKAEADNAKLQMDAQNKEADRQVKLAAIETQRELGYLDADVELEGIASAERIAMRNLGAKTTSEMKQLTELDYAQITNLQRKYSLDVQKFQEVVRSNKAKEQLDYKKLIAQKQQKSAISKSKK